MANDNAHLVQACRRIAEDSLYTAQTHFEMAAAIGRRAKAWLVLFPSVISALSGLAVAIGAPAWIGGFAAIGGVMSGVASFLGVEKEATSHEIAGKLLTQLRLEALALCDTHANNITAEEFAAQVRALQYRYSAFVASLPLTDDKAFKKAQAKVQSGTFKYDADSPVGLSSAHVTSLLAPSPPALVEGPSTKER